MELLNKLVEAGDQPGIFSSTVQSFQNGIVCGYSLHIDHAVDADIVVPKGYVRVSVSESISGAGITRHSDYFPKLALLLDKMFFFTPASINPTMGTVAEIPHFTPGERASLYMSIFEIETTLRTMLDKLNIVATIETNLSFYECLMQFKKNFKPLGLKVVDNMIGTRLTINSFFMMLYRGFELRLEVTADTIVLTDLFQMLRRADVILSAEDITGTQNYINFRKIPKYTTTAIGSDGSILDTSPVVAGDFSRLTQTERNYKSDTRTHALPFADMSLSMDASQEAIAQSNMLIRAAIISPKIEIEDKTDQMGEATVRDLESCGFEDLVVKVPVIQKKSAFLEELLIQAQTKELEKQKAIEGITPEQLADIDRQIAAISIPPEKAYDLSAISVKLKSNFSKFLHTLAAYRAMSASMSRSLMMEDITCPVNTPFTIERGESVVCRQKIASSDGQTKQDFININLHGAGFVQSVSVVQEPGIKTCTINYINFGAAEYELYSDEGEKEE